MVLPQKDYTRKEQLIIAYVIFELFRVDKKSEHLAPSQEAAKFQRFTDGFVYYSKLLPEEDRKSFLESVTPENILKNTENEKTYSVLFRRVFEDGIH